MRKLWALLLLFSILFSSLALLPSTVHAQPAKWTFMVYMGGDSSLESFGIDDFVEMASVGSTTDVNIVVQFDRNPSYSTQDDDWTTAKRYLVQKDMRPNIANALEDLGEVNMGDPQTLVDFANWGMSYSAERYALILWGHGKGWQGVVQDSTSGSDYLELDELKWAFEAIMANNSGMKMDLVGADACRMTIEMNYQLKDYVNFFVGSQKDEPEPGWPYDTILLDLTNDSDMGPAELGRVVVDRYVDSYVDNTGISVALSLIDSASLEYLAEEMRRFVEQARSALPMYIEEFKAARLITEKYEGDSVYDLHHVLDNIQAEVQGLPAVVCEMAPSPLRLVEAAASARFAIYSTVSYERHWDNPMSSIRAMNPHGMSIWHPLGITDLAYLDLDFSKTTGWDKYLIDFKDAADGIIPDPEIVLDVDMTLLDTDGNGLDDTVQLGLTSPQNATLEIDIRYPYPAWEEGPISIFLPRNVQRTQNLTLYERDNVDLELYLLNDTRVWLNFTKVRNVMGFWYTISGRIFDRDGTNLSGATVTVRNLNNDFQVMNESYVAGNYFARILLTGDMCTPNAVQITVEYEDWVMTTTIEVYYHPDGQDMDIVLGETDQIESDQTLMWILVILVIIEVIFILMLALIMKRRGKEPAEKSGEELLKELKVD